MRLDPKVESVVTVAVDTVLESVTFCDTKVLVDKVVDWVWADALNGRFGPDRDFNWASREFNNEVTRRVRKAARDKGIDLRVKAIRNDHLVGWTTCTSINEAHTDAELTALLDEARIRTEASAVKWARKMERDWRAVYDDVRATAW